MKKYVIVSLIIGLSILGSVWILINYPRSAEESVLGKQQDLPSDCRCPEITPKEVIKEVVKEVPGKCDYSKWRYAIDLDATLLNLNAEGWSYAVQALKACKRLDRAGVEMNENKLDDLSGRMGPLRSERERVLNDLGL